MEKRTTSGRRFGFLHSGFFWISSLGSRISAAAALALLLVLPLTAAAAADRVTVTTAWNDAVARPGDQRVLAVVVDMAPKFHINPDEAQARGVGDWVPYASALTVQPAEGLALGPVQWPRPHEIRVEYAAEPILVYEGRAVVFVPVTVATDAAPGTRTLQLSFEYQVCDDKVCYPPTTAEFTAALEVVPMDAAAEAKPQASAEVFRGFDLAGFGGAGSETATAAPVVDAAAPRDARLAFDLFGWSFSLDTATAAGFTLTLLVAVVGGLLLNFTPCVLPVVPLKVMSLARASHDHRGRTLLLGVVMFLGVLAFWLVIGGLIAFTTRLTSINELFSYPWFTIGVGVFIAVMAVGMCGLFTVQLPRWVYMIPVGQETVPGSFGFGVMTAVLSTPCTAPFMGAAAGWAITQPPTTTLLTFTAIGVGMGLPYLVLAAFPALVSKLPRTGPGSELLKQVMGILMLAAASYFVGAGINGLITDGTRATPQAFWWFVYGFIAAAGLWLAWRAVTVLRSPAGRGVWAAVGLIVAVVAVVVGAPEGFTDDGAAADAEPDPDRIPWVYYSPEAFDQTLAAGEVIVLDFTADWCINCKVLEKNVLESPAVRAALQSPGVTPMKVDITSKANVAGRAKLDEAGRVTIPLLVVFAPDGREVFKSDFYKVEQVLAAIASAKAPE